MAELQAIDESIVLWVQDNLRSDMITPFIQTLTRLGDYGLLWICFSLILMINKDTRKAGKLSLVSIALCFLVNNLILKNLSFQHYASMFNASGPKILIDINGVVDRNACLLYDIDYWRM